MDFAGYPYYKLNHLLLSFIRLWVYDDSWLDRIQRFFCSILLVSGVIVQITPFVTSAFRLSRFLKDLPYLMFALMFVLKYDSFYFNMKSVKELLDRIQCDWNKLHDEEEFQIIKKYADNGRLFTLFFSLCIYPSVIAIILSQSVPVILNIAIPLNKSRTFNLPVKVEYFVDEKKYIYFILAHLDLVAVIGSTAIVATETLIMVIGQHLCGMFKIASHRIEHAMDVCVLDDVSEKCYVICARLVSAVEAHRRAMEFVDSIRTSFMIPYLVLMCLGVLAASVNLFRFTQAVLLMDDIEELLTVLFLILGQLCYLFILNYIGQDIVDHSDEVFRKTYDTIWYMAPLPAQKLLLFIMQRSVKTCVMIIGGVYVPCFEGFSAIGSASLSYFMVIYTTQ